MVLSSEAFSIKVINPILNNERYLKINILNDPNKDNFANQFDIFHNLTFKFLFDCLSEQHFRDRRRLLQRPQMDPRPTDRRHRHGLLRI
jgi:hypothetical protein